VITFTWRALSGLEPSFRVSSQGGLGLPVGAGLVAFPTLAMERLQLLMSSRSRSQPVRGIGAVGGDPKPSPCLSVSFVRSVV
jgi:hypothetical protein